MTYTVSGGTLNPTHSLTHSFIRAAFLETVLSLWLTHSWQT